MAVYSAYNNIKQPIAKAVRVRNLDFHVAKILDMEEAEQLSDSH